MHCLMTEVWSKKCAIRQFHHCMTILECTYTNLCGTTYTPRLCGVYVGYSLIQVVPWGKGMKLSQTWEKACNQKMWWPQDVWGCCQHNRSLFLFFLNRRNTLWNNNAKHSTLNAYISNIVICCHRQVLGIVHHFVCCTFTWLVADWVCLYQLHDKHLGSACT